MWATEYSIATTASPDQVWRVWVDVAKWPEWNHDIERIELRGAFEPGGTIVMTTAEPEPIELRIAEAFEPELFVDEGILRTPIGRRIALRG